MAQINAFYPPSGGGSSSNASVGSNGVTAPTSSTEIGFIDGSGNLQGVSPSNPLPVTTTPAAGSEQNVNLNQVNGATTATGHGTAAGAIRVELPTDGTGVVTANQGTANTNANAWPMKNTDGTNVAAVKAASTAPATTDPALVVSLSPNGGQATAANQTSEITQLTAINSNTSSVNGSKAPGTAATNSQLVGGVYNSAGVTLTNGQQAAIQLDAAGGLKISSTTPITTTDQANGPVSPGTAATKSELQGLQYNTTLPTATNGQQVAMQGDANGRVLVGSIANALPAGTNTLGSIIPTDGTNQIAVKPASTSPLATDNSLVVTLSPNSAAVAPAASKGRSQANAPTVTTYATPVTSAAYTQIVASTTSATNMVEIFDSSGVAIYFATGASGSEVNQFVIYPGGNGQIPFAIPAGTRISYKAVSTSASGATAYNVLNLYT